MDGKIHSLQSLGTVDGPGVRYVVFLQGCPLRCGCCHNPDTWDFSDGKSISAQSIVQKMLKYKDYFGTDGGITVSGGEPLLQAEFVYELFVLSKNNLVNTCLDTSGCIINDKVLKLLSVTDRVLLDIKYTNNDDYLKHVGCSLDSVLDFLSVLNTNNIKTTLRQVIIPTLNDDEQNILNLNKIIKAHPCIDKVELLPFKKICQVKYDELNINFPFKDIPTPTKESIEKLNTLLEI